MRADPTLSDLAAAAGVSRSTAGRAMSGHVSVRDDTRRRVQAAARRLGYEPNRVARSLRSRNSMFVGIVVPDIAHGFYGRTVKAAQDILEAAGYQVLVMNTDREPRRDQAALRTLLAHRVDGILVASSGGITETPPVPTVFFDNLVTGAGEGNVARANKQGMDLLVGHLVEVHGFRRIAYLGGPPILTSGVERLEGFHAAMGARRLPVLPERIALGDEAWSPESGTLAMRDLLGLPEPPEAVITASDTLALGAIQAVRDGGMAVPEHIALVSFDDPFFGAFMEPQLTALRRDERALGEEAAALVLQSLRTGARGRSIEVRIPVELTVRRSCGCRSGGRPAQLGQPPA